jgi:hypothetical protein
MSEFIPLPTDTANATRTCKDYRTVRRSNSLSPVRSIRQFITDLLAFYHYYFKVTKLVCSYESFIYTRGSQTVGPVPPVAGAVGSLGGGRELIV